jgi:UDP-N-acetylglucosamine:LPS N-acetylglucosamine transferase
VYPALAVLEQLASNLDVKKSTLWVGGVGGMEAELVKRAGVPFTAISAGQVAGIEARRLPVSMYKISLGVVEARRILRRFKPDVMLFTGGYIAVPVALAGRLPIEGKRRPSTLLYVPDIEPGLAIKTLVRFVDYIALTADDSRVFFREHPSVAVTGYPLRQELYDWTKEKGRQVLGLSPDVPVLLVSGGSRGSRTINRLVIDMLPELLPLAQVVHISGQLDWPEVSAAREALKKSSALPAGAASRYRAYPYLHKEMGAALAAADLAVTRAGASALGELPLFSLPAVLVPYPHAWRYQKVNAAYLARHDAAVVMEESEAAASLLPLIKDLLSDRERLEKMSAAMKDLAQPDAARKIAGILSRLTADPPRKGSAGW